MLAEDGRINFLPLLMIPHTIIVNGIPDLIGNDGMSVTTINELVLSGLLPPDAGSPSSPLRVEGELLNGKQTHIT